MDVMRECVCDVNLSIMRILVNLMMNFFSFILTQYIVGVYNSCRIQNACTHFLTLTKLESSWVNPYQFRSFYLAGFSFVNNNNKKRDGGNERTGDSEELYWDLTCAPVDNNAPAH